MLLHFHPIPFVLDIPGRMLLFALNINQVPVIPGGFLFLCLINSLWMTSGLKKKYYFFITKQGLDLQSNTF